MNIRSKKDELEAAQQTIRFFEILLRASTDGIAITDVAQNIITANEAFCAFFDAPRRNVIETNLFVWLEQINGDAQQRWADLEKQTRLEGACHDVEFNLMKKHENKWLSVNASLLERVAGEDTGVIISIWRDTTERKQAEERIKQNLKEKEVLLREIHHRVKNNMQVTIGMLKLQSDYVEDKKSLDIFIEVQNRMKSMALVHEKLYESEDLANISFKGYVNDLLNTLFTSYGVDKSRISSKVNVEDALFEVDFATPCGLIITELVSNSLKHAFPMDKDGEIIVSLSSVDDGFELIVCDDGTGFPEDISFETTKSFGLNLVKMLVEGQLEGEIKVDRSKGTQYHIGFKRPVYSDSITI